MTLDEIKELNAAPFDWCYDCARVSCKTLKQKMFAWITCFLLRCDGCKYEFSKDSKNRLVFSIDLRFILNENDAVAEALYKSKNWTFLGTLIYNHTIHNLQISKETGRSLLKPKIKIKDSKVFVVYNC